MVITALRDEPFVQHADSLLDLCEKGLAARSKLGWSRWLQGETQAFLPHDLLIAAWGDFRSGSVAYDVITRNGALLPRSAPKDLIEGFMTAQYQRWIVAGQHPLILERDDLWTGAHGVFSCASCALVHGVSDHRTQQDCLYLFAGPAELAGSFCRKLCSVMLPFIDLGFRQLADRGKEGAGDDAADEYGFASSSFADCHWTAPQRGGDVEAAFGDIDCGGCAAGERGGALSARELEVMEWVRMGKTNSEIAMILNLSTFTVKNHMRRIYKKLDVLNRAQAVGSLDRMAASQHSAR
jgi:transcriptional regulator EpsA